MVLTNSTQCLNYKVASSLSLFHQLRQLESACQPPLPPKQMTTAMQKDKKDDHSCKHQDERCKINQIVGLIMTMTNLQFKIVISGQFCALAMFLLQHKWFGGGRE